MTTTYMILTILFIIIAVALILIILVQRPQGGGLAGAFGGAGGGGTDSVFGGRVGDALTYMTVGAFAVYLVLAISLNLLDSSTATASTATRVLSPTTQTLRGSRSGRRGCRWRSGSPWRGGFSLPWRLPSKPAGTPGGESPASRRKMTANSAIMWP